MGIYNNRERKDWAQLNGNSWVGIQQGIDGYPIKNFFGENFISGSDNSKFKVKMIEFYGFDINQ